MKYIDEFRNKKAVKKIAQLLHRIAPRDREINLMEVCGTHTNSFFRYGLNNLIPENVNLLSGPGCPVCVSHQDYIDKAIQYAKQDDVIIATFGDMLRVPGASSSLEQQRAEGADIRIVYSPMDAIDIALKHSDKKIIFLGVGFETTIPTVALTITQAKKLKVKNFFVFCSHKLIPPAMKALLNDRRLNLQGFICPGHVSTIIGSKPYQFVAKQFSTPCVIAGFEPLDMLEGIVMLLKQIAQKRAGVEIQYSRVVRAQGNVEAQKIINQVFEIIDDSWRGLGVIPKSGLRMRKRFADFDAEKTMPIKLPVSKKMRTYKKCLCGEVLKGIIKPPQCPSFGKACTPASALGPCMVSFEGACSVYYKFGSRRSF
ncbi:hydrogenase formation protein HypD [Candidatus Omnitrophota bacterium]